MAEQSSSGGREGYQTLALNLVHQSSGREEQRIYGRIISSKAVRNFVVRTLVKVAWARSGHVKMKVVDENTMAFEFDIIEIETRFLISPCGRCRGTV